MAQVWSVLLFMVPAWDRAAPPRQGSVTIKKWDFRFLFQTVQDILKEPYSAFGGVAEYFTIKLICLQSLII